MSVLRQASRRAFSQASSRLASVARPTQRGAFAASKSSPLRSPVFCEAPRPSFFAGVAARPVHVSTEAPMALDWSLLDGVAAGLFEDRKYHFIKDR